MTLANGSATRRIGPERGAAVPRIPPPLYFGGAFALGMMLRAAGPSLAIGGGSAARWLGAVVLVLGLALCVAAVLAVVRHHTTIVPHHPASTLLTTGAFRISRNPMYSGLAVAYVGGALVTASWWPLATLPLALILVHTLVIRAEERYLSTRFGEAYRDYQKAVRRWL